MGRCLIHGLPYSVFWQLQAPCFDNVDLSNKNDLFEFGLD